MKFLHAADIHLDSPLEGLERYEGAPIDLIRGATRRALENLVDLALNERIDFVLIAGDLYDGDWRDFNTGMFFIRQMARLSESGIPVYVIAGNHDAANSMTRKLRLPVNRDGLSILLSHDEPETRKLAELGVAIHGRSFANQAETQNMVPAYPSPISEWFNIGLLHTSLNGSDEHDTYAPCTPDDLRAKCYEYWALGHIHKRSLLPSDRFPASSSPALYSGNIQGRHIRESGPRGCFVVDVNDQRQIQVEFRPLDVFRWETCSVRCEELKTVEDILERFSQELRTKIDQSEIRPLGIRVLIEGTTEAHQELSSSQEAVTAEIRSAATIISNGQAWVERVKISTKYPSKSALTPQAEGPLAELERYLDSLPANTEELAKLGEELKDLARKLPGELLQPPDGLLLNQEAWLREVMQDLKPIILERLKN